jgi:hypothetical protein
MRSEIDEVLGSVPDGGIAHVSVVPGESALYGAGGLIHLVLDVVDLDAGISRVTAAGGRLLVGPVPDVACDEQRIAFVHLGGQVTELVELPR